MVYGYVDEFAANSYVDEFSSPGIVTSTYRWELVDGGSRSELVDVAEFAAIWWPTCCRERSINRSVVESVSWNESEEQRISNLQTWRRNHSNRGLVFTFIFFVDSIFIPTVTYTKCKECKLQSNVYMTFSTSKFAKLLKKAIKYRK